MKQWAAVLNDRVVHGGFDAPQSYIDNYEERIVQDDRVNTPPWWTPEVEFVDVTGIDPRPVEGFTLVNGEWVAPEPEPEPVIPTPEPTEDQKFVASLRTKRAAGTAFTPAERDRAQLLILERLGM